MPVGVGNPGVNGIVGVSLGVAVIVPSRVPVDKPSGVKMAIPIMEIFPSARRVP